MGPRWRIGLALQMGRPTATTLNLGEDVAQVKGALSKEKQGIFELVAVAHGLGSGEGSAQAKEQLETACRRLSWPRCDAEALRALTGGGKP